MVVPAYLVITGNNSSGNVIVVLVSVVIDQVTTEGLIHKLSHNAISLGQHLCTFNSKTGIVAIFMSMIPLHNP